MVTVGIILASMESALLDPETNTPVPAGKNSRLLVREANFFLGYLRYAPSRFVDFDGKIWYDTGNLIFDI
ncbi:MAG: hypothetical protein D3903_02385 [Candidatus Electrothrix sp. GM3_4]|nr:hypothetical protein [Candidatus Electrothrix sp. GM3_4]